jgi:intracellular septation protein A
MNKTSHQVTVDNESAGGRPGPASPAGSASTIRLARCYLAIALAAVLWLAGLLATQFAIMPSYVLLLIVVVGILGIVRQWRWAPAVILTMFAAMLWRYPGHRLDHPLGVLPLAPALSVAELSMIGGVLTYMVCHYRLSTLGGATGRTFSVAELLPVAPAALGRDPSTRPGAAIATDVPSLQAAARDVVGPVAGLLAGVVFSLVAGLWMWQVVIKRHGVSVVSRFSMPRDGQLPLAVLWALIPIVFAGAAVLRYAIRRRIDRRVAELELNETVWRELRRELESMGRRLGRRRRR